MLPNQGTSAVNLRFPEDFGGEHGTMAPHSIWSGSMYYADEVREPELPTLPSVRPAEVEKAPARQAS